MLKSGSIVLAVAIARGASRGTRLGVFVKFANILL